MAKKKGKRNSTSSRQSASSRPGRSKPKTTNAKRTRPKSEKVKSASAKSKPTVEQILSEKGNLAAELLRQSVTTGVRSINRRTMALERVVSCNEMQTEFQLRKHELHAQYKNAEKAIKKLRRWIKVGYFGQKVRCTIGLRVKHRSVISPLRYVIQVLVPFKCSQRWLAPFSPTASKKGTLYCIPAEVDNVQIKVVESRLFRLSDRLIRTTDDANTLPGLIRKKSDGKIVDLETSGTQLKDTELIGGLPTTEINTTAWGTLGIVVKTNANKSYALVNAHFGQGTMVQPPKKPTSQQDIWDIGKVAASDRIENDFQGFYVDAALVELNSARKAVIGLVQDLGNEQFLFADRALDNDRDLFCMVFKFGSRTSALGVPQERLQGYIENAQYMGVEFDGIDFGTAMLARSSTFNTFTDVGDSGSVLVAPVIDHQSNRARLLVVGLCFGGYENDSSLVVASHFSAVRKALNLDIPSQQLCSDWSYPKVRLG